MTLETLPRPVTTIVDSFFSNSPFFVPLTLTHEIFLVSITNPKSKTHKKTPSSPSPRDFFITFNTHSSK